MSNEDKKRMTSVSKEPVIICVSSEHSNLLYAQYILDEAVFEEIDQANHPKLKREIMKRENPTFLNEFSEGMKIAMVNMEEEETSEWEIHGQTVRNPFKRVSEFFEWQDLSPEWIDEEEEINGLLCLEIPMPDLTSSMFH